MYGVARECLIGDPRLAEAVLSPALTSAQISWRREGRGAEGPGVEDDKGLICLRERTVMWLTSLHLIY